MYSSAEFLLAHVVQEKHREWTEKMSVCVYSVLLPYGAMRKTHVNGLKNCLCMRSSALVFTGVTEKRM